MLQNKDIDESLKQVVLSEFYSPDVHLGIMVFGSTASWTRVNESDIDIIIFPKNSSNFNHYLDKRQGYLFDVFEMPLEYAFQQLSIRQQMWIFGFNSAHILIGEDPLSILKNTAQNIIKNEDFNTPKNRLDHLCFMVEYRYKKLYRFKDDAFKFNFFLYDFFDSLNIYLHTINFAWPDPAPRSKKLDTLLYGFDKISEIVKKIIVQNDIAKQITHLEALMSLVLIKHDLCYQYPISVQNINIQWKIDQMVDKLK